MSVKTRVYLDNNASTPMLSCVRNSMMDAFDRVGNASSIHFEGRDLSKIIESARSSLALLLDVDLEKSRIIFTSGATEAANLVLSPKLRNSGEEITISHLYVSAIEHPCVLEGGRFASEQISRIPVTLSGVVDLDALQEQLEAHDASKGAPMIALMLANNETGVIQPIKEASELVHQFGGYLVVDAVQALGKMPFSIANLGADFVFVSGHKIGASHGAGALIMMDENLTPTPMMRGGGQEHRLRPGTENVAAIAGFGAACEWHKLNLTKNIQLSDIRDSIERELLSISSGVGNKIAAPVFFGKEEKRLSNTSCFAVAGIRAETALMALDLDGVSISSGSACSSGTVKRSHVLEAMGVKNEEIEGALRVSLGWEQDWSDAKLFLDAWNKMVSRVAA